MSIKDILLDIFLIIMCIMAMHMVLCLMDCAFNSKSKNIEKPKKKITVHDLMSMKTNKELNL